MRKDLHFIGSVYLNEKNICLEAIIKNDGDLGSYINGEVNLCQDSKVENVSKWCWRNKGKFLLFSGKSKSWVFRLVSAETGGLFSILCLLMLLTAKSVENISIQCYKNS